MKSMQDQLTLLIEEGESFNQSNFCYPSEHDRSKWGGDDTPEWLAWKNRCIKVVQQLVADDSSAMKLLNTGIDIKTSGYSLSEFLRAKETIIKSLKLALELTKNDKFSELRKLKSKSDSDVLSNKVFIVHGHDQLLKTELENFLNEIGLDPVVLHRQSDEGKTIIEKFEKHSDVGYAFILLTPDEVAYTADQESIKDEKRTKEKRARPNVIFEFGYFIGKLGRSRVCCIHKGDIDIPSDLSGFVYKKITSNIEDEGYSIIKELKTAGYNLQI